MVEVNTRHSGRQIVAGFPSQTRGRRGPRPCGRWRPKGFKVGLFGMTERTFARAALLAPLVASAIA
ncbi:MAG: hypothetical protein E5X07_36205, partial [Mesorhizobium sp.]